MAFAAFSRSRGFAALALMQFALLMGTAQPAMADKALIVCSATSPDSFYPGAASTPAALDATEQVYDRLLGHEAGIVKLVPALAVDWNASNDGLIYVLQLRKGVQWHANSNFIPTRDFNADDVIFSIERQWKENHPYHKVGGSKHEAFNDSGLPKLLQSIEKADDYVLRITLSRPDAGFPAMLAMNFASIQSKEYADHLLKAGTPEQLDEQPIGTGQFMLTQHSKDKTLFSAFPRHWRGPAATQVTNVLFVNLPDASERFARLKSGDCDIITEPNPSDLSAMRDDSSLQVHEMPALNIAYLAFNTQKKPFDDVRARKAFSLALDKKAIVASAYPFGTGASAISPLPPAIWSYNKSLRDEPYMPSVAKKLLGEASFPASAVEFLVPAGERPARIATMIRTALAEIGVQVEIKTLDNAEFVKRTRSGEHQLALMDETGGTGDPSILNTLLGCENAGEGGRNVAKWCNPEFQHLMKQGMNSYGIDERRGYYEQAQTLFRKQVPWLPLAYEMQHVVARKDVTNFKISPFGRLAFVGVRMTK